MKVLPIPRLYLGTMTFGWSQSSSYVDEGIAKSMMQKFINLEKKISSNSNDKYYIDTARIYAGGKTESIIGQILKDTSTSSNPDFNSVVIGTKAHPSQPNGLSPKGITDQLKASFDAMGVESVDEFYLHQPDTEHSLLESLQCVDQLVKDGKIKTVGMSNYHVTEVSRTFELCEEYNLRKPTVYQGLYNPLNRVVEKELLPLLKANKCSFVAYNPLAAGLLTGKHKQGNKEVAKGRFKNNQNYLPRFYTDENFNALKLIQDACEKEGITLLDATFQWFLRYSALTEADGILLGASSIQQLEQNLDACLSASSEDTLLSPEVLKAFDDAWKVSEPIAFPYWRSYSSDMPNRESLDQGASYSAAKK
mmetsp:Transcript_5474/g.6985  ORF Transcript_5474/g.6985 Transcript_5474/m.6985 type:complete len:364 (-) Transcript_5474:34-1125(-)